MARFASGRRRGLSLVETVITMAVSVVVIGAGAAALHAVTRTGETVGVVADRQTAASVSMMRMRREIRLAKSVSELTSTAITFTLPDITGDAVDDIIRYAWSGTPGSPVTRRLNAGSELEVIPSCSTFSIGAGIDATLVPTTAPNETSEMLVAQFDSYPALLLPVSGGSTVSSSRCHAETFIPTYSGAAECTITRVLISLRKPSGSVTGNVLAEVRAVSSGTENPISTYVAQASFPASSLSSSYSWVEFDFPGDVKVVPDTKYALVITANQSTVNAGVENQSVLLAHDNGVVYRGSTTGGASWSPTSNLHLADFRFQLYGKFTIVSAIGPAVVTSGYLKTIYLQFSALQSGTQLNLTGATECLNRPDLTGMSESVLPIISNG